MNRDEVLDVLRAHKQILSQRYGVSELTLFGPFARDKAKHDSDIDILVSYDEPATSKTYFEVQFYLEDLLGRQVELVIDKDLRKEFRPYVDREAINI